MLSFLHQLMDPAGHDSDSDTDSFTTDTEDDHPQLVTPVSPTFTALNDMDEDTRSETLQRYGYRAIMQLAEARGQISKLQELCEEQQQLNAKLQVSRRSTFFF